MAGESRVARLIGDGDMTGGGLPLPVVFTAVTEDLLDNGEAGFNSLLRTIRKSIAIKEARILGGAWRTWEDFARDVIAQMCDAGVLAEGEGIDGLSSWHISDGFEPGKWHNVIPGPDIGFTAWGREARVQHEANSGLLMALREAKARYPDASKSALWFVTAAEDDLDDLLAASRKEGNRKARKKEWIPPGQRPPRPTAHELAAEKYALDGIVHRTQRVVNPFIDGVRPCPKCNLLKRPEDFSVYWESGHNNEYFLRGTCKECERNHKRDLKEKKRGS